MEIHLSRVHKSSIKLLTNQKLEILSRRQYRGWIVKICSFLSINILLYFKHTNTYYILK